MKFDLHTQRYVDWKVYNVTPIKNKYGFRVKLIYADGTSTIQQKSGYTSKKAAEQARTEIIGQLYANAYVVYENILLEEFLEFWLEDVMRPKMKNSSYVSYRNSIHRHINPHLGKVKLTKLNRGHIQQLYNKEMKVSESGVKLVKTVMNTAMGVRRRIEIGVNCILNSRLLPTQLCSHTDNCTVQEGKLQLLVALF